MAGNTAYKNKFISEKYDRINLTLPKGLKEQVKARAQRGGLSINAYLYELIRADLALPEAPAQAAPAQPEKEMEYYLL